MLVLFALLIVLPAADTSAQSVENFEFRSFEAEYFISRDDEGRSSMHVVETLVAEFPEFDQNKGIIREIPHSYQGQPLSFELLSLERNGEPEPVYDESRSGEFIRVSTGTDDYLHGTQTYEITYQLRDVVRDFDEHQELFWDINGTSWRQPFGSVSATVHLDNDVADNFTGTVTCYEGPAGSRDMCDYQVEDSQAVFTSTRPFSARENLSIVMEFEPGTFEPYAEGTGGTVRAVIAALSAVLSIAGIITAVHLKLRARNHPGRGVIVRQYLPPKHTSVLWAAMVNQRKKIMQKAVTAQILELAVNRKIKIVDTGKKQAFGLGRTIYELEIIDLTDISLEGEKLLRALFGTEYQLGKRHKVNDSSSQVGLRMAALQKKLKKEVIRHSYRRKTSGKWVPAVLSILGFSTGLWVLVWLESLGLQVDFTNDWRTWGFPIGLLSATVTFLILGSNLNPLTKKGRELSDYLEGMKEYISLAETERLRFAQSPDGAQRTKINTNNTEEVIKLYERLLPYAVLFGKEKEWFKQLGNYYEQSKQTPYWYAGTGHFSARSFSSAMSQVSSAASSSSSSGFSGGAGSGGGGGGGGGGGR